MQTIHVLDMSCMHCVNSIKKALDTNGINHIIDLNSKTVKVDNLELGIKVIKQLGFNVAKSE